MYMHLFLAEGSSQIIPRKGFPPCESSSLCSWCCCSARDFWLSSEKIGRAESARTRLNPALRRPTLCGELDFRRRPCATPRFLPSEAGRAGRFDMVRGKHRQSAEHRLAAGSGFSLSVKNRLDEAKFRCFPVKRTLRRQECT